MSPWTRIVPYLLVLGILSGAALLIFGIVAAIRQPERRGASILIAIFGLVLVGFGGLIVRALWSLQGLR